MSMTLRRRSRVFVAVPFCLAAVACTSGGVSESREVYRWVPGVYQIEGELRYRSDTSEREITERLRVLGEVTVDDGRPRSVETLEGICLEPEPTQDRSARRFEGWDVRCGELNFTLWPDHDRVRGTVTMLVTELRRVGACVLYSTDAQGNRTCARYAYNLESDRVTRTASMNTTLTR